MELSSDLIVENNIELCFTYSLENLKNSQYIHRMETNESFKKKQVFYKKGNNQSILLGSAISNIYIATNTVGTD